MNICLNAFLQCWQKDGAAAEFFVFAFVFVGGGEVVLHYNDVVFFEKALCLFAPATLKNHVHDRLRGDHT